MNKLRFTLFNLTLLLVTAVTRPNKTSVRLAMLGCSIAAAIAGHFLLTLGSSWREILAYMLSGEMSIIQITVMSLIVFQILFIKLYFVFAGYMLTIVRKERFGIWPPLSSLFGVKS